MKKITIKEFFDLNVTNGTACIHCDTKEKAKKLLAAFSRLGKTWNDGKSYLSTIRWNRFKTDSCYDNKGFSSGQYFYWSTGCRIYEFDDIDLTVENSTKLVYISGAISDVDNAKELFAEAEDSLRSLGCEVINPCKVYENMNTDKFDYADYIMASLMTLKKCDYIYFLDNAEQSDEAKIEMLVAKRLGIKEVRILEYKRLTNTHLTELEDKLENGTLVEFARIEKNFEDIGYPPDDWKEMCTHLTELEDKLENGTLVELPCKVGNHIFTIGINDKIIDIGRVTSLYIDSSNTWNIWVGDRSKGERRHSFTNKEHKKIWYATKEEAEAKLKELKEQK